MNKKLLALAIGSALGAAPMAASLAKVTVGGHLQVEVVDRDIEVNGVSASSFRGVEDNNRGRIIISAEEKLGNGMTALAKFEWKVNTTDGSTDVTTGGRESMVGLKGNFGQIELGSLKSAYKYAGGVNYDPFVATALEARGNGGMTGSDLAGVIAFSSNVFGHNGFIDNSIAYQSNNFSGFTFRATYSPDEAGNNNGADGDYTLSAIYKNGPMELFVAGAHDDIGTVGVPTDLDQVKVGGQYKFGNHTISAQWENMDATGLGVTVEADTWFVGWQMAMGNNTFVAQYGQQEAENNIGVTLDTTYYALGVIHNMSKNTRVHVGYRNTEAEIGGVTTETSVFSAGLRVIF